MLWERQRQDLRFVVYLCKYLEHLATDRNRLKTAFPLNGIQEVTGSIPVRSTKSPPRG